MAELYNKQVFQNISCFHLTSILLDLVPQKDRLRVYLDKVERIVINRLINNPHFTNMNLFFGTLPQSRFLLEEPY